MINLGYQQEKSGAILIVDDSSENISILVNLLKDKYQVKVLKSAQNITNILGRFQELPDLILLDVLMPEIDGYEACRRLKSNALTKDIPIVFITTLNDDREEARGFSVGAVDFITKPFNPDIVKARVNTQVALRRERLKTELLLSNILPAEAIRQLKKDGRVRPKKFDSVAVLFSDMVDFTKIASSASPEFLMNELSEIFTAFDQIVEKRGGERIKLIGDAYMAACGIAKSAPDSADRMIQIGWDFIAYLEQRNQQACQAWHIRIGVHTGEVIAGVVGTKKYQYDVFGDTVNIASRVENQCQPNHICITEAVKNELPEGKYPIKNMGDMNLKGKGRFSLFCIKPDGIKE